MASGSSNTESFATNPGAKAFRSQFNQLVQAIQAPTILASELYSKELIPKSVLDKVLTGYGLGDPERNILVLNAVDSRLRTNYSDFEKLLGVLETSNAVIPDLADRLRKAYDNIQRSSDPQVMISQPEQEFLEYSQFEETSCVAPSDQIGQEVANLADHTQPAPNQEILLSQPLPSGAMSSVTLMEKSLASAPEVDLEVQFLQTSKPKGTSQMEGHHTSRPELTQPNTEVDFGMRFVPTDRPSPKGEVVTSPEKHSLVTKSEELGAGEGVSTGRHSGVRSPALQEARKAKLSSLGPANSLIRSSATELDVRDLHKILLKAIGNGCMEAIASSLELLTQDGDCDYIDEWEDVSNLKVQKFHYSPLMLACHLDKTDIVEVLLDKNATIYFRKKEKGGLNAFHVACSTGNLSVVTLLIEKARLQLYHVTNEPCLKKALRTRNTNGGLSPLMFAIRSKSEESGKVIKALLETGVIDVECTNKKKHNIFHIAVHEQKQDVLAILHEHFSKLQAVGDHDLLLAVDESGWGVLHHACAGGTGEGEWNCEILQWLFDNVPQLNSRESLNQKTKKTGYTPLLVACEYQKVAVVKKLLEITDVDVSVLTVDNKNGLHIAAIHDCKEIADILIKMKSSLILQQDSNGDTPLHIAQRKASFSVKYLLEASKEAELIKTLKNEEGLTVHNIQPEDVIPAEIRKRGPEVVEIYKNALKKGKRKNLQCNLLILGQTRVGKTSLYRLLVGEPFIDSVSTRGINKEVIEVVDRRNISTAGFKELTEDDIRNENDADFADSCLEEFTKSTASFASTKQKPRKPQATSDQVLIKEIQSIRERIQKRIKEDKIKRKAALDAAKMRPKPPTQPTSLSVPMYSDPLLPTIPKPEQRSLKGGEAFPKQPEPPKPTVQPSQSKQAAQTKERAPAKRKERVDKVASSKPAEHDDKEEEIGAPRERQRKAASGPLLDRRHSKAFNKMLKTSAKKVDPKLRFTTLDFAGQREYRPMHHCFITRRAIYIVVFNLQDVVKYLQSESSESQIANPFEEVRYWLNSISAHIPQQQEDEKLKRILLVGTHRGPHKDCATTVTSELHEKINKKLRKLFFELKSSKCINHLHHFAGAHIKGDQIFAAVENSIDGHTEEQRKESGAKPLQEELQAVAKNLPFLKEVYPHFWLIFENRLMDKRDHLRRNDQSLIVEAKTVEGIAHDCGIVEPQEIEIALKFFHEVGKICCLKLLPTLFISQPEQETLASLVLLDPKWLIAVMRNIMELDISKHKGVSARDLEVTGVACVTLLQDCLADCCNANVSFEQLCLILKAFGLIHPLDTPAGSNIAQSVSAPVEPTDAAGGKKISSPDRETEGVLQTDSVDSPVVSSHPATRYLIPCKLPAGDKSSPLPKPAAASGSVELFFDFSRSFLPDEVFQRLICLLLAKSQAEPTSTRMYRIQEEQFTQTKCQFYFDECLWEIEHEVAQSVLKVSIIKSYSKYEKKASEYLKKVHVEFLYNICKGSGLDGLMYRGGWKVDCHKCGWSGILPVLEYTGVAPPTGPLRTRAKCEGKQCNEWIDIDELDSKPAVPGGRTCGSTCPPKQLTQLGPKDLKEVRTVVWEARSKWNDIGIEVGLQTSMLRSIANENCNDDGKRLTVMLEEWLKQIEPEPSWEQLVEALQSKPVNLPNIAQKIVEQKLSKQ